MPSKTFKIKDTDKGLKKLLRKWRLKKSPKVKVGVLGGDRKNDQINNVQLAIIHEFGTDKIPKRSFIRDSVDQNKDKIQKVISREAKAIADEKYNTSVAMERLGLYIVGVIKKRISTGIPPALEENTIKRKGSSIPLIDTGQLRNSITHEVK